MHSLFLYAVITPKWDQIAETEVVHVLYWLHMIALPHIPHKIIGPVSDPTEH